MNHTCLCLPSRSWYSFTDPGGMEGWVGLGNSHTICDTTVYIGLCHVQIYNSNERKLRSSYYSRGCTVFELQNCSMLLIVSIS